ncbi:MAG: hypothetical protein JXB88_27250 [Spirochaetales bacterium]|nr:hypothetical protein [Spirochaetales bacterium]
MAKQILLKNIKQALFILFLFASVSCDPDIEEDILDNIPPFSEVGMPLFTALPLDQENFTRFIPLGNLNPPGHTLPTDHHYFVLTDYLNIVPVYAPGKIWITEIRSSYHHSEDFTDYDITFYACREVMAIYGHISSLSTELSNYYADAPAEYSDTYDTFTITSKRLFVEIDSGEIIGTAGGNPGQHCLDFGVYDSRVCYSFANPSRYHQHYKHAVPCLDYYEETLQNTLESMCERSIEPIGGTVALDIPGSAQGNWFTPGEPTYPEDMNLALVHDNIDPAIPVFSVGTSISALPCGCYSFSVSGSGFANRDSCNISADGNLYNFPFNLGTPDSFIIVIQLVNANTLRIEIQAESDAPWDTFLGIQQDFVR